MAERKTMRKDNKILLVVSFLFMGFGAMLGYRSDMFTEIVSSDSPLRAICYFLLIIGFVFLMAAIGREGARRD